MLVSPDPDASALGWADCDSMNIDVPEVAELLTEQLVTQIDRIYYFSAHLTVSLTTTTSRRLSLAQADTDTRNNAIEGRDLAGKACQCNGQDCSSQTTPSHCSRC